MPHCLTGYGRHSSATTSKPWRTCSVASCSLGPMLFKGPQTVQQGPQRNGATIFEFAGGEVRSGVLSGGILRVSGGDADGIVVSSGGSLAVSSGGTTSDTVLSSGGALNISSAGIANAGTVLSGGTEVVSAGGTASGATVSGGGRLVASSGATASGGTFSAEATDVLHSGGTETAVAVGSGALLDLADLTIVSGAIGTAYVQTTSGAVSGASVASGGIINLLNANLQSGGILRVSSGAAATSAVESGGSFTVFSGGSVRAATLNGGQLALLASASASGTIVMGGLEIVAGQASGDTVLSSGRLTVSAGGLEGAATVSSGGQIVVSSSGLASGTVVGSGGALVISSGGAAIATTVLSGGAETVKAGGVASGETVTSGGTLTIASGGAVAGGVMIVGGKVVISGAMSADQTATFVGSGGVLVLDSISNFSAAIAGLTVPSQLIDLGGFTFSLGETVSWTEADDNTSGSLTITDGALAAQLTLDGSYVTSNFVLSDDGSGGTYIADPRSGGSAPPPASDDGGHIRRSGRYAGAGLKDIEGSLFARGARAGPSSSAGRLVTPSAAQLAQAIAGFEPQLGSDQDYETSIPTLGGPAVWGDPGRSPTRAAPV